MQNTASAVLIYHAPIFPTSNKDCTVCEMDWVTLLFCFFAYFRHMSGAIHRRKTKRAQSVLFGKHVPEAERQKKLFIIVFYTQFHSLLSLNFFFFFFFDLSFLHSCLQNQCCSSRVSVWTFQVAVKKKKFAWLHYSCVAAHKKAESSVSRY